MNLINVTSNKLSSITSQMTRALPSCFRVTAIKASISPKGNQVMVAQLSQFQADIRDSNTIYNRQFPKYCMS